MVTVRPAGDGVLLFWTSCLLLGLSWLIYVIRVTVRIWRKALGMDDFLMCIGILFFTVTASLCIVCTFYGSGQRAAVLPASTKMKGIKLFFMAEFFYAWSAVMIKCSIAVTLLRIAGTRRHVVYTIWGIMIVTGTAAAIFIVGIANICHPITTLWGETTTGSCNLKLDSNISFFFSAVEIATDWSFAILPAVLLWNIQMKTKVKASVAMILGLAAFASCATIIRLRYLSLYSNPNEFMFGTAKIGLWSIIEEGIGVFAGSLPALRPLLSLPIFGGKGSRTAGSSSHQSASAFNKPRTGRDTRSNIKMDTFQQLGDEVEVNGDGDSQKHILKETHITTVTDVRATTPGEWERSQVLGWKQNKFQC